MYTEKEAITMVACISIVRDMTLPGKWCTKFFVTLDEPECNTKEQKVLLHKKQT